MHADLSDPTLLRLSEHPQRRQLNSEAHARPALQIAADNRLSYLAYLHRHISHEQELWLYRELAQQLDLPAPDPKASQFQLQAPFGRVRWEPRRVLHPQRAGPWRGNQPLRPTRAAGTAAGWPLLRPAICWWPPTPRCCRPARCRCASKTWPRNASTATNWWARNRRRRRPRLHRLPHHADGFSRYLLADFYMGRRQAGRMLQRLLELETYRMLALLGLAGGQEHRPELAKVDEELAELTGAMGDAGADEPQLLHRLTELAGATENALSRTDHRFNASLAYYDIARCRIAELRERRIRACSPSSNSCNGG